MQKQWKEETTAATLGANPSCCAAANLPFCKGIALEYLKRFFSTIPSRRLVLVFVTEIVHIFWINIFVLQYSSVIAHLFVYMKLYVFINVYNNYTTCRWHGSCRTYPKKTPMSSAKWKTQNCISPVSSVKCFEKKSDDMGPLHPKNAKHVMSTNSHTVHFTSHMNKNSIWAYDYVLRCALEVVAIITWFINMVISFIT